jgi:hypothetical protein
MKVRPPEFAGKTVVVVASGPSLTPEDCELVRNSGHAVIVTNTSFRLCPWADVLFAFDVKWWDEYHEEVKQVFKGRCMTYANAAMRYGAESVFDCSWFTSHSNSGACAIGLAIAGKAKHIILLGADCQRTGGKTHWHGDHPKVMRSKRARKSWPMGMSNADSMNRWPAQYQSAAMQADIHGVEVINASRETALTCFKRARLEDVL